MKRTVSPGSRLFALLRSAGGWLRTPAGRRAQWLLSLAVSLVLIVILVRTVSRIGWEVVLAGIPGHPMVYVLFYLAYFIPVGVDWYFYHRWWGIGPRAFGVFLKKRVMNEALISYSGDTYLVVWASAVKGIRVDAAAAPLLGRTGGRAADPATNPLAAVKDVALMSGLAGNSLTLLMLVLALALGGGGLLEKVSATGLARNFALGFGVLVAFNVGLVLFRQRVLSLPSRENRFVLSLHVVRLVAAYGLVTLSPYNSPRC